MFAHNISLFSAKPQNPFRSPKGPRRLQKKRTFSHIIFGYIFHSFGRRLFFSSFRCQFGCCFRPFPAEEAARRGGPFSCIIRSRTSFRVYYVWLVGWVVLQSERGDDQTRNHQPPREGEILELIMKSTQPERRRRRWRKKAIFSIIRVLERENEGLVRRPSLLIGYSSSFSFW